MRTSAGAAGALLGFSLSALGADLPALPPAPNFTTAGFESTAFPGERYLSASLAFVSVQECKTVFDGSSRIDQQGTQGTATAGKVSLPYPTGECPGKTFPNEVTWYTWTGGTNKLQDSFLASFEYPPPTGWVQMPVTIKLAAVHVNAVDMAKGYVDVDFNGSLNDVAGTVTLEFVSTTGTKFVQTGDTYLQPGSHQHVTINRPAMPQGTYNKVNVLWKTLAYRRDGTVVEHTVQDVFTPPSAIKVLGLTRYSQYNTPAESQCTSATEEQWVVDSLTSCNFTSVQLKSDFVSQVKANGTGVSAAYGVVKSGAATSLKKSCAGKFPDGANIGNSVVQVPSVTGACNKTLVANSSIAMYSDAAWKCNNKYMLVKPSNVNQGARTNADKCPGCSDGHIDNYSEAQACSAHDVGDLGNFWTVKTN